MSDTTTPTSALMKIIAAKIAAQGSISLMEYMDLALAHPDHGYYRKYDPLGARGDFVTSPEISQIFGEMIGVWVAEMWRQMGGGPLRLVELGPGRGTLMADLLRATKKQGEFHDSITVHMVETSPVLANAQYMALRHMHERIDWLDSIDEIPEGPMIVVANEFFDALPIRQYVMEDGSMRERRVRMNDEGALEYVLGPAGLSLAKSGQKIADGTVIENNPAARSIMHQLAERMANEGGAALIIDYGYLGDAHHDTLQAVKAHAYHPVLKDPGEADLTAHVDFLSLANIAAEHGLYVSPLLTQGQFLHAMGGDVRLKMLSERVEPEQKTALQEAYTRITSPQAMGELFKVLAVSSHAPIVGFDE